jgi:hypothetical protein
MEALREDIKHREDVEQTALSLLEFIEKQGDANWADDLLRELGPWLMVQLADLANFFESVRKYDLPYTKTSANPTQKLIMTASTNGANPLAQPPFLSS